ncbi:FUSC family protein [Microlunatus flavus]|uniref:Aromatic acid exporter family member 1 n=1 Tax=Microlunatus flavus TaxID=1036181 RepID=A0A1H9FNU1_9ACTN|nr:aromatic acid exporter family protein [Microlunatus flavus]SEQ39143.1 Aromatic acid exporter family member 1 [Microlunatus flavus]
MVARVGRWLRSRLRALLWWWWPTSPTTWSQVPGRLVPTVVQVARLTIAAVVAYVVAGQLIPAGAVDLTAPLTALLVVQASTVGTLRMGLVRVGAVLTGVLVAVAVGATVGLTWWSLALVIAASLVLAKVLRLAEQSLEAPISAMLILAVSAPELAAEVRIGLTLVGTVVGVGFSLVAPVAIPNARAAEAVRRVARSQAALLNEVALALGGSAPDPAEVAAWSDWVRDIDREIAVASTAVRATEESRTLNARALTTARVHDRLLSAVERLDRCLAAEQTLIGAVAAAPHPSAAPGDSAAADLRRAYAVVLDDLADGLRALGDVLGAQPGHRPAPPGPVVDRLADIVRESRAVLAELLLLDVDPRRHPDLWLVQGSVLTAVDQILTQLDLDLVQPSARPRLRWTSAPDVPRRRRHRGRR